MIDFADKFDSYPILLNSPTPSGRSPAEELKWYSARRLSFSRDSLSGSNLGLEGIDFAPERTSSNDSDDRDKDKKGILRNFFPGKRKTAPARDISESVYGARLEAKSLLSQETPPPIEEVFDIATARQESGNSASGRPPKYVLFDFQHKICHVRNVMMLMCVFV